MAQLSEKELKKIERLLNLEKDNELAEFDFVNELEGRVDIHEERIEALDEKLSTLPPKLDEFRTVLEEKIKTIELTPGKTPVKGVDYFTAEEIEAFKKAITPIKGKDYQDGDDGYTPVKGKDYFDGEDGNDADPIDEAKIVKEVLAKLPKVKNGDNGKMPKHEMKDGWLRFENPDGSWGKWERIKGEPGTSYSVFGGGGSSVSVRNNGSLVTTSANSLNFQGFNGVSNNSGNVTVVAPSADLSTVVPYTGATGDVNLGDYALTAELLVSNNHNQLNNGGTLDFYSDAGITNTGSIAVAADTYTLQGSVGANAILDTSAIGGGFTDATFSFPVTGGIFAMEDYVKRISLFNS